MVVSGVASRVASSTAGPSALRVIHVAGWPLALVTGPIELTPELTALLRCHLLEPLAERPATFRGKRSEFLARLAQGTAFLRRQPPEALEALADALALVGWELAPPLQPLLREPSLLRAHG